MALSINGTTGISGVDGSASAPALQGTDSNTGINFASDTVNINTGGTTRATVDSNGRLGIGTTSPAQKLDVTSSNNIAYALDGWALAGKGDSSDILMGGILPSQFDTFSFYTSGSERVRINSSGHFLVGVTGNPSTNGFAVLDTYQSTTYLQIAHNTSGAEYSYFNFQYNGSTIGTIKQNSAGNAISFNTSSDYRLKENVVSISDGITRLKTLKPSRFNFKNDTDTTVDGFLAHEVTAVPEAITGTKDEVATEDNIETGVKKGDPIYHGIDQSKLVPLLTAALQEAIAKIEVLETKVAALEAG